MEGTACAKAGRQETACLVWELWESVEPRPGNLLGEVGVPEPTISTLCLLDLCSQVPGQGEAPLPPSHPPLLAQKKALKLERGRRGQLVCNFGFSENSSSSDTMVTRQQLG